MNRTEEHREPSLWANKSFKVCIATIAACFTFMALMYVAYDAGRRSAQADGAAERGCDCTDDRETVPWAPTAEQFGKFKRSSE